MLTDVEAHDVFRAGPGSGETTEQLRSLGRFPFGENLGRQGDWAALMVAICYSDPPEPSPATASPEFRGFIACCLQKNPANRLSAAQLLQHPFVALPQPQPLAAPPS